MNDLPKILELVMGQSWPRPYSCLSVQCIFYNTVATLGTEMPSSGILEVGRYPSGLWDGWEQLALEKVSKPIRT